MLLDGTSFSTYSVELSSAGEAIGTIVRNLLRCLRDLTNGFTDGVGSAFSLALRRNSAVLLLSSLHSCLLGLGLGLPLLRCRLFSLISLDLLVSFDGLGLLLPGLPFGILFHLMLF